MPPNVGYHCPMVQRCAKCIFHQYDENGRQRCAKGIDRGPKDPCKLWRVPIKTYAKLRYDGYYIRCVETDYWNSFFGEIDYAVWINFYELPFNEAEYGRKPDHVIRFQAREWYSKDELRLEALELYNEHIKPEDDKIFGKA